MKFIKDLGMQEYGKNGNKARFGIYLCECCGEEKRISSADFKRRNPEKCRSCCNKVRAKTHGFSKEKLYAVWNSMKNRCFNKNNKAYIDYGGRGISICSEWNSNYSHFKEWSLNNGYKDGLTIDRKNNDLGYSPENCRWVDSFIQANNRRCIALKAGVSGIKGIHYAKRHKNKKWSVNITENKKKIFLGNYKTKEEALTVLNEYLNNKK